MSKKSMLLLYLLPAILMSTVVPLTTLYFAMSGLNTIAATIIVIVSLLIAGIIGVVGSSLGFASSESWIKDNDNDEMEELNILRATVRSMIEETENINNTLEEIKNVLKGDIK